MIVVLDTNALRSDPTATGGLLSALLDHAQTEDGFEVWLPKGVYGELVRQYPGRLGRMDKISRKIAQELKALGVGKMTVPDDVDAASKVYEAELERRFTRDGAQIAPHPRDSSRIVDWVALRRHPIKEAGPDENDDNLLAKMKSRPISGVVDAAIWLTVLEAAHEDRVALITNNKSDFGSESATHPTLLEDLEGAGIHPEKVQIFGAPDVVVGRLGR